MQQIERYGVIALVFMAATVVGVTIWDDGGKDAEIVEASDVRKPAQGPRRARVPASSASEPRRRSQLPFSGAAGGAHGAFPAELSGAAMLVPAAESQDPLVQALPKAPARSGRGQSVRRVQSSPEPERREQAVRRREEEVASLEPQPRREPARTPSRPARTRAAAAPERKAPASGRTYVVRGGDTLGEIAQRELGSAARWTEIQTLNPSLDPLKLHVGKELSLPAGSSAPARSAPPQSRKKATSKPSVGGDSYRVREGDMLSSIARRELGSGKLWPRIAALNPSIDPDRLVVGAVLVLPPRSASSEKGSERVVPRSSDRSRRQKVAQNTRYKVR